MKKWSEFLEGRCWPGYKPKPGKKAFSPGSCMKESWSQKYKSSINCSHPKGFSQKAHCAGKNKHNESHEVMEMTCPDCGMCKIHGAVNESAAAAIAAATAIAKQKSGDYDKEGMRKTPYKNPDSPNRKSNAERRAELKEDLRKWFSKTDPKGDWKRINSKGEAIGPCAREPGEPKPKCMSQAQRASLSKKERASAVRRKRQQDPNAERQGAPINVKSKVNENMKQLDEKNKPTNPELWSRAIAQAKSKFDVYPSAYANGWASKKYKEMGGGWKSVSEESELVDEAAKGTLHRVRYSHDSSSGNGIASGNLSLHAPDKDSARRYAESDLKKRGKKNINIHSVTPQKSSVKEEFVQEGRPSQRHPLEGHEYHKKSNEALIHIAKDAHAAAEAMKSHNTTAENKYRDQANDSATVRYFRQKNGMPEWYKKKYGHIKESKDEQEYGYEGDMALNQLATLTRCADMIKELLKPDTDMPEWVQSKITLATDYIQTAADYMYSEMKEEVEPIEELSKNTLKSYIPAAARDLSKKGINAGIEAKSGKPGVTKEYGDHFEKRYNGIIKATRKLAKEEVSKTTANMPADIGTPAQLSLKATPKKLETLVYESRQLQIVREAMADAKKKDAIKKKEQKVTPGGDDKFQSEPELTSSITKNT